MLDPWDYPHEAHNPNRQIIWTPPDPQPEGCQWRPTQVYLHSWGNQYEEMLGSLKWHETIPQYPVEKMVGDDSWFFWEPMAIGSYVSEFGKLLYAEDNYARQIRLYRLDGHLYVLRGMLDNSIPGTLDNHWGLDFLASSSPEALQRIIEPAHHWNEFERYANVGTA